MLPAAPGFQEPGMTHDISPFSVPCELGALPALQ